MKKNDGGPAFPTENAHQTGNSTFHEEGMTLRDYFAAKAMQGMISHGTGGTKQSCAKASYMMADAMLAAREVNNVG